MRIDEAPFSSEEGTYGQFAVRHSGTEDSTLEAVAEEVPVALEFNGVSHAVMFASPADLEDFALGFALTEGIVASAAEIFEIEARREAQGITVALRIATERFVLLKDRRRSLAGRTGCGLCGTESLDHATRTLSPVRSDYRVGSELLYKAFEAMRRQQRLMALTGAVHAAGWLGPEGSLVLVREDVGRHNALDKLFGGATRAGLDLSEGAAILTSRASFEMVQKAATMGVGLVAAISAPTALAIRMADSLGITLLGFVRNQCHAVYSHAWRIEDARLVGDPVCAEGERA